MTSEFGGKVLYGIIQYVARRVSRLSFFTDKPIAFTQVCHRFLSTPFLSILNTDFYHDLLSRLWQSSDVFFVVVFPSLSLPLHDVVDTILYS